MIMTFIGCDIGKKGLDVYHRETIVTFENKKEGIKSLGLTAKRLET
ncbi:hypothetical protein AGMMS49949_09080 [Alphaproteobacteria bacterium]|nr:hypothetical protein AGMMS49949_09080 [Alphaproteobacteria bacterium]GHT00503.1 hypothetical protein AGMMS50296_8830 [Alphaproteobacteria bacterium]